MVEDAIKAVDEAIVVTAEDLAASAIRDADARAAEADATANAIADAALATHHSQQVASLREEVTLWHGSAHDRIARLEMTLEAALEKMSLTLERLASQPAQPVIVETQPTEAPVAPDAQPKPQDVVADLPVPKTKPVTRERRYL